MTLLQKPVLVLVQDAVERFGADEAYSIEAIDSTLPKLLENRSKIYYLDEQDVYQTDILKWINLHRRLSKFDQPKCFRQLLPLQPYVHNFRVIKSDAEVLVIKKAVSASVSAHKKVMQSAKVGLNEFHLEAVFNREIAEFG